MKRNLKISVSRQATTDEAISVRQLWADGFSIQSIADLYDHSYTSINRIVRGITFKEAVQK